MSLIVFQREIAANIQPINIQMYLKLRVAQTIRLLCIITQSNFFLFANLLTNHGVKYVRFGYDTILLHFFILLFKTWNVGVPIVRK